MANVTSYIKPERIQEISKMYTHILDFNSDADFSDALQLLLELDKIDLNEHFILDTEYEDMCEKYKGKKNVAIAKATIAEIVDELR